MRRSFAILALAAAAVVAAPAGADTIGAQGGGANNVVLVQIGTDQSWHARSHLQIASVAGDTVASTNLALARAEGCTGCREYVRQMRETIELTGSLTPADVSPQAEAALLAAFRDWKAR